MLKFNVKPQPELKSFTRKLTAVVHAFVLECACECEIVSYRTAGHSLSLCLSLAHSLR